LPVEPRFASSSRCATPALYITKPPKAEHDAEEWQTAMDALILVATLSHSLASAIDEPGAASPLICPNRNRILLSSTL
jgi:hypothetical protein